MRKFSTTPDQVLADSYRECQKRLEEIRTELWNRGYVLEATTYTNKTFTYSSHLPFQDPDRTRFLKSVTTRI